MGASASVIQEYYKAVDYWADIAGKKDWKLAIWIVGRNDVDLVDKFLEIERSPVGQFDDIFFRFDTPYRGDDDEYAAQLWQEYAGWFEEQAEEKDDMLKALRHDGLLKTEYRPDTSAEPTAANLWKEMLRFKECISRLENAFFCIYFPPEQSGEFPRTEWFGQVLKEGVPQGIRLTTIDLKKDRNVALDESPEVVHIRPRFDMAAALHNRMARADAGNDLIAPENRFKQQVTAVMDCTRKQDLKPLEKEIRKLLDIAGELKDANIRISALFIASEACYAIREYKSSMKYSDKTIREAEKAMKDGEAAGYSYWKMAVSMKAAILTAEKKREEAVALYEEIAGKLSNGRTPIMSWRATGCAASCGTRRGSWNRRSNISCWHWREEAIFPKTLDGVPPSPTRHTWRSIRAGRCVRRLTSRCWNTSFTNGWARTGRNWWRTPPCGKQKPEEKEVFSTEREFNQHIV